MIEFLKKYKAFIFGYSIVLPLFYLLEYIDVLILPKEKNYEILIYAIIWGFIFSLPIHYFHKKRKTVMNVFGLLLLIFIIYLIDSLMDMPDNPITIILLMGFWIGFAYLLLPTFVKKYWQLIAFFYIPLFLYFMYLRLFSGDLEAYLKIKEEFPFFIFFIPIPILIIIWFFEQWRWLQNLKTEKSLAELALLRSQINPHFFFNTLNNLYALTIKNSKKAPEVILKLSDMMRYTIYQGEKELVTLKDEIQYLENYIELHKIRYKKTVDIQFEKNIDTSLQVAPLLFIILLENAFKHGIETLTENAYIHLSINESDQEISFEIENNFDPKVVSDSSGIGLQNLQKRLSLLYLNKHDLQIHQSNDIYKTTLKILKNA